MQSDIVSLIWAILLVAWCSTRIATTRPQSGWTTSVGQDVQRECFWTAEQSCLQQTSWDSTNEKWLRVKNPKQWLKTSCWVLGERLLSFYLPFIANTFQIVSICSPLTYCYQHQMYHCWVFGLILDSSAVSHINRLSVVVQLTCSVLASCQISWPQPSLQNWPHSERKGRNYF